MTPFSVPEPYPRNKITDRAKYFDFCSYSFVSSMEFIAITVSGWGDPWKRVEIRQTMSVTITGKLSRRVLLKVASTAVTVKIAVQQEDMYFCNVTTAVWPATGMLLAEIALEKNALHTRQRYEQIVRQNVAKIAFKMGRSTRSGHISCS